MEILTKKNIYKYQISRKDVTKKKAGDDSSLKFCN